MVVVSAGTTAYVWNVTGTEPHLAKTLIGHTDNISSFVFSSPSFVSGSDDGSVKFWKIGTQSMDLVGTDLGPTTLTPVTIMSITLQAEGNISITSDSDGAVKTWDIFTGLCKASFQTPAKSANKRDVQLINGRLVLAWHTLGKIKIWDVEKEELLLTVDGPYSLQDIKISEDGSRVFSIGSGEIQTHSIQTGEIMGKARIMVRDYDMASLTVSGPRVWVRYLNGEGQVWDFGTLGSSPVELPNMHLEILHPNGAVLWDTGLSCVREKTTGKVVFWLSKRYGRPVTVQWNNQYLFVSFICGKVLVLDFSHVPPL